MDFEVIEIIQSVEDREKDYVDINEKYGNEENDFSTMWSSYLVQVAPITEIVGLYALWKLSKTSCFEYDLNFSSSFLVMVKQVDYSTLSVDVEILDDESRKRYKLPRQLRALLTELYITKEQGSDRSSISVIARCLDQLRVFYKYLWWPWDADNPGSKIWFTKNLQHRLKLYEDLTLGNYSESMTKKIKTLIEKGKFFYGLYVKESGSIIKDDEANSETKRKIVKYVKNVELIKESLEICTKKSLLSSFLRYGVKQDKDNPGRGFLVVNELNLEKMVNCTRKIAKSYPSLKIRQVTDDLEYALSTYENDDTIFLSPGEHSLSAGCLNTNVTIKGFTQEESVTCRESYFWYLLKTTPDNINLHNLTICSEMSSVLIYVKEGITCMDFVTMNGSTERQKAIIVGQKATLVANGCQFNDFSTAIICLPGSAVQLINCVFRKNSVAINVVDDAQLCLSNITAVQSKEAFIRYQGDISSTEYSSLEELSNIANVSVESVEVDAEYPVQFI